jgi:hypothetical protein
LLTTIFDDWVLFDYQVGKHILHKGKEYPNINRKYELLFIGQQVSLACGVIIVDILTKRLGYIIPFLVAGVPLLLSYLFLLCPSRRKLKSVVINEVPRTEFVRSLNRMHLFLVSLSLSCLEASMWLHLFIWRSNTRNLPFDEDRFVASDMAVKIQRLLLLGTAVCFGAGTLVLYLRNATSSQEACVQIALLLTPASTMVTLYFYGNSCVACCMLLLLSASRGVLLPILASSRAIMIGRDERRCTLLGSLQIPLYVLLLAILFQIDVLTSRTILLICAVLESAAVLMCYVLLVDAKESNDEGLHLMV